MTEETKPFAGRGLPKLTIYCLYGANIVYAGERLAFATDDYLEAGDLLRALGVDVDEIPMDYSDTLAYSQAEAWRFCLRQDKSYIPQTLTELQGRVAVWAARRSRERADSLQAELSKLEGSPHA
jgi:hypothetical protein